MIWYHSRPWIPIELRSHPTLIFLTLLCDPLIADLSGFPKLFIRTFKLSLRVSLIPSPLLFVALEGMVDSMDVPSNGTLIPGIVVAPTENAVNWIADARPD
jgi:hypothetical protein